MLSVKSVCKSKTNFRFCNINNRKKEKKLFLSKNEISNFIFLKNKVRNLNKKDVVGQKRKNSLDFNQIILDCIDNKTNAALNIYL